MDALDFNYLADLVRKAQAGNNNAFAELYAATYERQYRFSCQYLRDEFLAQDALQETFVQALKNIRNLQKPELVLAWLNRINMRVCYDMKKKEAKAAIDPEAAEYLDKIEAEGRFEDEVIAVDSSKYIMSQVMNLPLTESQAIIMYYYRKMSIDEIAKDLSLSRSTVKRYLKSGREHLAKLLTGFR